MEYEDLVILVKTLESRIKYLENENIETTNSFYELENKIDAIKPPEDSEPVFRKGIMYLVGDEEENEQ